MREKLATQEEKALFKQLKQSSWYEDEYEFEVLNIWLFNDKYLTIELDFEDGEILFVMYNATDKHPGQFLWRTWNERDQLRVPYIVQKLKDMADHEFEFLPSFVKELERALFIALLKSGVKV